MSGISSDPYASRGATNQAQIQEVSTSSMVFGDSDDSYANDHKSSGCCACSASCSNFLYAIILCTGAIFAFVAKFAANSIIPGYGSFCPKDSTPEPFIVNAIIPTVLSDTMTQITTSFDSIQTNFGLPIPSIHDLCVQNQTIYRISAVLATFFLIMMIVTFIHRGFHYESWIFKFSFISGLFTISAFIPGQFFAIYREIARWCSFLFIVMQVLTLVDFAHSMHENIVRHIQNDGEDSSSTKKARLLYLFLSVSSIVSSVAGVIVLFIKYSPCGLHTAMIIITLLLGVIVTGLSLTSKISKGLLPPSLLTLACVVTTYQALSTNTTEACVVNSRSADMPLWVMVVSFLIAIGQVAWMSISAANSNRRLIDTTAKQYTSSPLSSRNLDRENPYSNLDADVESSSTAYKAMGKTALQLDEENQVEMNPPRHWIFHFTLVTCAMYLAMMLTGWGSETATSINNPEASIQSFWIKILSVWACFGLYIWTMIAPLLFPDRDFSSH